MNEPSWIIDKSADNNDHASALTELANETAILQARAKAKPKQVKNKDGTWPTLECVECGENIGLKRLEITGSDLCIDCAELLERRKR